MRGSDEHTARMQDRLEMQERLEKALRTSPRPRGAGTGGKRTLSYTAFSGRDDLEHAPVNCLARSAEAPGPDPADA